MGESYTSDTKDSVLSAPYFDAMLCELYGVLGMKDIF